MLWSDTEAIGLDTYRLHLGHFVRVLGEAFPVGELTLSKLQRDAVVATDIDGRVAYLNAGGL